jgi:hypothetical protein
MARIRAPARAGLAPRVHKAGDDDQIMAFKGREDAWLLYRQDAIPAWPGDAVDAECIGLIRSQHGLRGFRTGCRFVWVDALLGFADGVMANDAVGGAGRHGPE